MTAMKYKHTEVWTEEDRNALTRYLKGLRGPREREANAKSCRFTRSGRDRRLPP